MANGLRLSFQLPFSILIGLGFWLAFSPLGSWAIYLIALSSFALLAFVSSAPRALLLGFLSGLIFFLPTIWWAALSTDTYTAWILLSTIQASFFGLCAFFTSLSRSLPIFWRIIQFSFLWAGFEQARRIWPLTGFPWATGSEATVGSFLGSLLPYISTTGLALVLALLAGIFASLALVLFRAFSQHDLNVGFFSLTSLVALSLVCLVANFWFAPLAVSLENKEIITLGILQGDVPQPWRTAFDSEGIISKNTIRVLREGSKKKPAQLYLAGETSLDRDPKKNLTTKNELDTVFLPDPIVLGYNHFFVDSSSKLKRYNRVFVWQKGQSQGIFYDKQRPVPYGEYIPFRNVAKYFANLDVLLPTEVEAGSSPNTMIVSLANGKKVNIAVGICYEVAFSDLLAKAVRNGGEFIYIPTNNSSFENSWESYQQLQILRVRARETNRWATQVSINGISAVVDSQGIIRAETPLNKPAYLQEKIALNKKLTPAVMYDDYFRLTALVLLAISSLFALIIGFKKRISR
ncbi:apolipoprotein N-acyltransferase [Actinomycetaceae bacterium TAE3-ERU4]|nr:apolipoprotein N-acyltransferase [Actinomycetaceae bacterium TAE3-ERU4]